jgi:hypothetical protein
MGAGAFAIDGANGFIVDSDNWRPWAELIASLPDRSKQRILLAEAARLHALDLLQGRS